MNKYSFKDILEKEIAILNEKKKEYKILLSKIEIPKIQRDYAQGRPQESAVRKRFLDNIFNTLNCTDKSMEMDFVYGSVAENTKVFTPLDGQQRLTTLFLLYWYIGTRELGKIERDNLNKLLRKFTYETRASSRDFCENLTKTCIVFKNKPSKEITNLPWFYKSYKQDPTIKSMLNMLDSIHENYGDEKQNLFEQLKKLQFYILPLNGFNLTDELYVKMNARGKQLADFENFKADLIKWIKDENNTEYVDLNGRSLPYYLSFSQKIDTTWTQYFWQDTKNYDVNEKGTSGNLIYPDGKIVGPLFMRLFYRYFLNKYILQSSVDNKTMDKENDDYQILYNEAKYQNFDVFRKLVSQDPISKFETFMDLLHSSKDILNSIQPSWPFGDKRFSFYDKEIITQPERVVFLGIMLFLEKGEFDNVKFKQWMRVVWNIVENTDIAGHESMIRAMKLISDLSEKIENSKNIYEYLSSDTTEPASSKNAVLEERQKAKFINSENSWEEVFIEAEKHPFFKGSIGFIITDGMTQNEFKHRTEIAQSVFDNKGVDEKYRENGENGHIFLRALISRYTEYNQLINRYYTDKEHYLKKMLASDEIVRDATREWFSLTHEQLENALQKSVNEDSKVNLWDNALESEIRRIRRAHEALYKEPALQNWMQKEDAIRFATRSRDGHLYVSKPRSWNAWIMLDSYRNNIITGLLKRGFKTENRIDENFPYYWGYKIEVLGNIGDFELKFIFDEDTTLKVETKIGTDEWKKIDEYNYVLEDEHLITVLEDKILNEERLKSRVSKNTNESNLID